MATDDICDATRIGQTVETSLNELPPVPRLGFGCYFHLGNAPLASESSHLTRTLKSSLLDFLVVQWLRLCTVNAGLWVQSLIQDLSLHVYGMVKK